MLKLRLCSGCAAGSLIWISRQLRQRARAAASINKLLIRYDGQLAGHAEIARFALWLATPRAGRPDRGSGSVRDGCHRDDSTLVGETRARTDLAARESARGAVRQTPVATSPTARKTTKLLVFDLGDARTARRGRGRLSLGGRRRVREAGLHLQDRAPHLVHKALLAQIITLLENLLEDERRRAF